MVEPYRAETAPESAPAAEASWPAASYAWAIVALLMVANCLSNIDRALLSLLTDPIKHALQVSDTQMGLLQSAFGLFMMLMTFPAGWVADRGDRMRLIAAGVALWSLMTAACGLAASYAQLFAARIGVAAGETVLSPTSPSIISDNFPPERRTLPLSLYGVAAATGLGLSMIAGGFVARLLRGLDVVNLPLVGAVQPWQAIFIILGAPGVLVSLVFLLTREPRRRHQADAAGTMAELGEVFRSRAPILLPHFAGVCVYFIHSYAYSGWIAPFFMRVHGWQVSEVGLRFGMVHVASAVIGGTVIGALAGRFRRNGPRNANLLTVSLLMAGMTIPAIFATLVPNVALALGLIAINTMLSVATAGPNVASIQEIVPNRLRGRVTAVYFALIGLIGGVIGPVLIGLLNDHVFADPHSVGKALALTTVATLPMASALVLLAARNRARLDYAN